MALVNPVNSMVRSLQSHLSSTLYTHNREAGRLYLILALFGVLVSRLYLFAIRPIQFFDESLYLAYTNGVLKYGAIPEWSSNPGVALLNALWFAPLYDVPLGLDYASRIGMVVAECAVFFLIAWLSYSIFRAWQWQILSIALALVAAPFWSISQNSSDTYYALWVVLIFAGLWIALHRPPTHPIWLAVATIIAISASIRNDGTLVFVGAGLIYAICLWRTPLTWQQRLITGVGVWLLPMGFVLLLYWGLVVRGGGVYFPYSDSVGMPANETSLGGRTYLAFEQGEGYTRRFEYIKQGKAWWVEGPALAQELYGSREQNGNNVFLAIARNPGAWLNRLKWNMRDFFLGWHEAFTLHALPIFLVAGWGWGLAWRHYWRFALATLIILIPTVVYFGLTFWSYRYVTFLAPLWILLATYAVFAFYTLPRSLTLNGIY